MERIPIPQIKFLASLSLCNDCKEYCDLNDFVLGHCKESFLTLLNSEPLYRDPIHQRLWELAFSEDAKCSKLRFACQVYDGDKLLTETVNKLMTTQFSKERFCSLDGSSCIREGMTSRMDSVIGDCAHSQVWALRNVFDLGYKPRDLPKLDFYEAGFNPKDFSPWWARKEPTYTCTYCENIFSVFGLGKSWGIYDKKWYPFYTKDSFYTSAPIALGEKKA